ncbi:MAG: hypothetical protein JWQ07_89 [Ramlibacter sp.]|nr:hypothetical protein [Ramlibacter sp.]
MQSVLDSGESTRASSHPLFRHWLADTPSPISLRSLAQSPPWRRLCAIRHRGRMEGLACKTQVQGQCRLQDASDRPPRYKISPFKPPTTFFSFGGRREKRLPVCPYRGTPVLRNPAEHEVSASAEVARHNSNAPLTCLTGYATNRRSSALCAQLASLATSPCHCQRCAGSRAICLPQIEDDKHGKTREHSAEARSGEERARYGLGRQ